MSVSGVSISRVAEVVPQLREKTIRSVLEQGRRLDGRQLYEFRSITVRPRVLKTANGSAVVSVGNTKVIAGVKAELGAPFKDVPDEGALIVNLEVAPTASPTAEPGPPDEVAIEAARVVDRTIRHSGFLDLKSLAVIPGKLVWVLHVDIYVLNHDGNIVDASTIAAVSAIASTEINKVRVEGENVVVDRSSTERVKVDVSRLPLTMTFVKIGRSILVDPTLEEESIAEGKFTIGIAGDKIVSIQKTTGAFTADEIKTVIDRGFEIYVRIRDVVTSAITAQPSELKI